MSAAVFGGDGFFFLLYLVSFVVVIWAVADIARQPQWKMSTGRKVAWILPCVLGWLLYGVVGAVVAAIYLGAVRPRLNS
jgi:uncharacterized membrane protein YczE